MKPTWIIAAAIPLGLPMLINAGTAPPTNDSPLDAILWLASVAMFVSCPLLAIVADRRARANRKSRNLPSIALLCWIVELVAGLVYIGSGAWYCETCANRSDDKVWFALFAVALPWAAACHAFVHNPKVR